MPGGAGAEREWMPRGQVRQSRSSSPIRRAGRTNFFHQITIMLVTVICFLLVYGGAEGPAR